MIRAVTVSVDIQTLDPQLPARLLGGGPLQPGRTRKIPGGLLVFQAALLNSAPGEASVYRFIVQFGARQAAGLVGNWFFAQLYGTAAALNIGGRITPVVHHAIKQAFEAFA